MSRRLLVVIPIVTAVLYVLLVLMVPAGEPRIRFYVGENATMKMLAAIGCFVAASRYRRGEYLGVAWLLIGVDYALLLTKDLLFGRVVHLPGLAPHTGDILRAIFVVAANLTASIGSIMMARVWRVAGIALPGSRAGQKLAMLVAIGVAIAIVASGTWMDLHNLKQLEAVISVASDVGDIVCFSVIAPLLLTAIAMRGGALAWPWALITASNVAWLLYDMSWSFDRSLAMPEPTLRSVAEFWRVAACALALSAGLAQRWAIRSAPRPAP